jgi:mannose-6-phosphate isomerase-like protein (cupin superfamily)
MSTSAGAPTKFPKSEFAERNGPSCRTIIPPAEGGWAEPAFFEWELQAESWIDEHPHTEYNYVIEGQVFVESAGVTVEAHSGDLVRVPSGVVGRYWAPKYARLLAIYGPSKGEPSRRLGYEKLTKRDE